jgi:hypothetical protein
MDGTGLSFFRGQGKDGYFRSEQLTDMGCGKHSLGEEQ